MSPADFTSPVVQTSPNKSINTSVSPTHSKLDVAVENLIDFQQPQKDNFASGGSSPSREVQEILSLNNPLEFFEDLASGHSESSNNFNNTEQDPPKTKEIVWPTIPNIIKAIDIEQRQQEEIAASRQELHLPTKDESDSKDSRWSQSSIHMINFKLSNLEASVNDLIQKSAMDKKENLSKVEMSVAKSQAQMTKLLVDMEVSLNKSHSQIIKLIEDQFKEQKRKEREMYEHLLSQMRQMVAKTVGEHLQKVLSHEITSVIQPILANEIKTVVLPSVLATFEKLHLQLDMHYSQKLNTIDQLLKSNLSKLICSKVGRKI